MINNRKGVLYFGAKEVDSGQVAEILAMIKFTPLRLEFMYAKNAFEMIGTSNIFPEVEQGTIVPNYDLKIVVEDEELISVSLKQ